MLGSKLSIFKKEWLDVVFAGRNQEYGAYVLRRVGPAMTTKALIIGVSLFVLAISSPVIIQMIKFGNDAPQEMDRIIETEVELLEPPPVDEATPPPPPPVEPPPPRVDQVRMPPPVVVEASKVKDEEPPTVEDLRKADPGPKTIEGDPTAEIRIDMPVGEGPKDQQVTESAGSADKIFEAVEIAPMPPGGMANFLKFVGSTYQYPAQAEAQGVSGRVILTFVVERDGSLTDIKIVRDLKYGTGEEAVRVLKRAKKWSPGIQNGRPVRVQYTLPIVLNLANQ